MHGIVSASPPAPQARGGRLGAAGVALVALAALVLQYALLLRATWDGAGPFAATVRFLSYFTVLSNLLVVLVAARAAGLERLPAFWAKPRTRAAAALYIAVTGLVYLAVLRHLWQPSGWQWWADAGLHYATPALYLAWWLLAAPHGRLGPRDLGAWLLFPLGFALWAFLRGAWVHEYPYPFLDVDTLGWARVLGNVGRVLGLFLLLGGALLGLDRMLGRAGRARPGVGSG
ncbi:Pr6Pr family membrane protein [Vulcaniibacterium tengchongense]|uniref:FAR-17a/AIG1-like protein n=1 Tax=Vulcaniibacterium tengchongense TaxID=1273429 RepID=A0A3N4VJK9_9GAMM|nr:Pr6Pr family membrane protein [Vulcaniibacterium tengchongense]RPE77217.1 hypothetical protein EDC50_2482 [Vulcaniibacterium tengchongense]